MWPHRRGAFILAAAASASVAGAGSGCATADVPVLGPAAAPDGTAPAAVVGTRLAYCSAGGPAAIAAGDGGNVCAQTFAQSTFRFAVCTCGDLVASHAVSTDSFDGALGAYSAAVARVGGGVGANGNLNPNAALQVGGSIWVGGTTGLTSSSTVVAGGELHAAGLVNVEQSLTVGTDAWLAGGLVTTGNALIPGTLHVPAGAPLMVGGTRTIGVTDTGPVAVPAPCDCAAPLDVAAVVEGYRLANDDVAAGVDSGSLANVMAPLSQTLPCGRLFFTGFGAHAPVTLTVPGRTALFVGGDLVADSDLRIDVPSGGDLDLFIEGNVLVAGQLALGGIDNPARARMYVGGSGSVNLQNAVQVSGNVYAPRAEVVLGTNAPVTVFGSVVAGRLNAGADLTVHFDESVARDTAGCPAPTGPCSSCHDCGGQACSAGACGACLDSTQCCAPAVCRSGTCVLDVR